MDLSQSHPSYRRFSAIVKEGADEKCPCCWLCLLQPLNQPEVTGGLRPLEDDAVTGRGPCGVTTYPLRSSNTSPMPPEGDEPHDAKALAKHLVPGQCGSLVPPPGTGPAVRFSPALIRRSSNPPLSAIVNSSEKTHLPFAQLPHSSQGNHPATSSRPDRSCPLDSHCGEVTPLGILLGAK